MRARISSNASAILKRMNARRDAVAGELSHAAVRIKLVVLGEDRKIISEQIYSVPIPTVTRRSEKRSEHRAFSLESRREVGHTFETRRKPKKEKLWKRTGQLLAREGGRTEGSNVVFFNPMLYSAARYVLGTAEGREIRSPGVKSVQWQQEALRRMRQFILEERRRALLRAFTGGAR